MDDGKRVLAVKIDAELFDELEMHVKKLNISKQRYISELVEKAVSSMKMAQVTQGKVWNEEEVKKAIDEFISVNGRVPKQTEFRNENGLPSYGAATRAMNASPAQYAQEKFDSLIKVDFIEEPEPEPDMDSGFTMSM